MDVEGKPGLCSRQVMRRWRAGAPLCCCSHTSSHTHGGRAGEEEREEGRRQTGGTLQNRQHIVWLSQQHCDSTVAFFIYYTFSLKYNFFSISISATQNRLFGRSLHSLHCEGPGCLELSVHSFYHIISLGWLPSGASAVFLTLRMDAHWNRSWAHSHMIIISVKYCACTLHSLTSCGSIGG